VNLNQTSGAIVGRFSFRQSGSASDMTFGTAGTQEMLFIGSTSLSNGLSWEECRHYTTDGHLIRSWTLWNHVVWRAGVRRARQTLYVTAEDSAEVYAIAAASPMQDHAS